MPARGRRTVAFDGETFRKLVQTIRDELTGESRDMTRFPAVCDGGFYEDAGMTERQLQSKFAVMAAHLILYAVEQGFEVTLGDAFRDPRVHGKLGVKMSYSTPNSFHKRRLAIDLNLFKNGKYLASGEEHRPLGLWWETQGGSWGGRFQDPNHYSLGECK